MKGERKPPFQEGGEITDEVVTFVQYGGELRGTLLFAAERLVSVKNYTETQLYDVSRFRIKGREISCGSDAAGIPFLTEGILSGKDAAEIGAEVYPCDDPAKRILFTETPGIVLRQCKVSYVSAEKDIKSFMPQFEGCAFSKTIGKLKNKVKTNILLFGDSISAGYHCSKMQNIPPYQESFADIFAAETGRYYGTQAELRNKSVGGYNSEQGLAHLEEALSGVDPDLVILGFGMNCGAHGFTPERYGKNMRAMTEIIKKTTQAEILLIATVLPNPQAPQYTVQGEYVPVLRALCEDDERVGMLNITDASRRILQRKRAIDLFANNINHPNDFMVRFYAMALQNIFCR